MSVDEEQYINFMLPAYFFFIVGLLIAFKKPVNISNVIENLKVKSTRNRKVGIALVIIGYLAVPVAIIAPTSLQFILGLISSFKVVGIFYLIFSNLKFKWVYISALFGIYAISIIITGVFINLFVWTLFFMIYISFQIKLTYNLKLASFITGCFLVFLIQSFKSDYRGVIYDNQSVNPISVFVGKAIEKANSPEVLKDDNNISSFIARLNQGWILTRVMNYVPSSQPYTNGKDILESLINSLIPRFLFPDKEIGGSQDKFHRFTGIQLVGSTTMNIGTIGDAYVNFGRFGGCIFMFIFGFVLNFIVAKIFSVSKSHPDWLLWIPLIFFYIIRAGNDFYVIFNFMIKTIMLLLFVYYLSKFIYKRKNASRKKNFNFH
jgi:hypothetical protein